VKNLENQMAFSGTAYPSRLPGSAFLKKCFGLIFSLESSGQDSESFSEGHVRTTAHQRHTSVTPASHQRHSIVCFFWRSPSCEFFGVQPGSPTSLGESSYVVLTRRGQHQECTSMLVSIIPLSPAAGGATNPFLARAKFSRRYGARGFVFGRASYPILLLQGNPIDRALILSERRGTS